MGPDGQLQRFCQQCGRFHPLSAFDGSKRSCRERLDRHNARRRKGAVPAVQGMVQRTVLSDQPLFKLRQMYPNFLSHNQLLVGGEQPSTSAGMPVGSGQAQAMFRQLHISQTQLQPDSDFLSSTYQLGSPSAASAASGGSALVPSRPTSLSEWPPQRHDDLAALQGLRHQMSAVDMECKPDLAAMASMASMCTASSDFDNCRALLTGGGVDATLQELQHRPMSWPVQTIRVKPEGGSFDSMRGLPTTQALVMPPAERLSYDTLRWNNPAAQDYEVTLCRRQPLASGGIAVGQFSSASFLRTTDPITRHPEVGTSYEGIRVLGENRTLQSLWDDLHAAGSSIPNIQQQAATAAAASPSGASLHPATRMRTSPSIPTMTELENFYDAMDCSLGNL